MRKSDGRWRIVATQNTESAPAGGITIVIGETGDVENTAASRVERQLQRGLAQVTGSYSRAKHSIVLATILVVVAFITVTLFSWLPTAVA